MFRNMGAYAPFILTYVLRYFLFFIYITKSIRFFLETWLTHIYCEDVYVHFLSKNISNLKYAFSLEGAYPRGNRIDFPKTKAGIMGMIELKWNLM
jgi:hypothetical protein